MAQIKTTSRGGLKKYTPGIISVISGSMSSGLPVKCGANSFIVSDEKQNKTALDSYVELAKTAETEQKAKSVLLKSRDGKTFPFGAIDKPKESGNLGDVR